MHVGPLRAGTGFDLHAPLVLQAPQNPAIATCDDFAKVDALENYRQSKNAKLATTIKAIRDHIAVRATPMTATVPSTRPVRYMAGIAGDTQKTKARIALPLRVFHVSLMKSGALNIAAIMAVVRDRLKALNPRIQSGVGSSGGRGVSGSVRKATIIRARSRPRTYRAMYVKHQNSAS